MDNTEFTGLVENLFNNYLLCKRFEVLAFDIDGHFEVEDDNIVVSGIDDITAEYNMSIYFVTSKNKYKIIDYVHRIPLDIVTGPSLASPKDPTYLQYLKKIRLEFLKQSTNFLFNYIGFNKFVDGTFSGTLG